MRIVMTAAAVALGTIGCSQARSEGPSVSRAYPVTGFERIEVAGPYRVQVATGAGPAVRASGSEEALERLVVEVRGDTLHVKPRKDKGLGMNWSKGGEPVELDVSVPALTAAGVAGSGTVAVDRIAGDRFAGSVAGSGDLQLQNVEVRSLKLSIAGSGSISSKGGQAGEAAYEIAGSGDLALGSLSASRANISIAGSGNVDAMATESAAVTIAGSGDVRVRGGARCQVSKAGSGNVDCS